jgi:hypothetical protein
MPPSLFDYRVQRKYLGYLLGWDQSSNSGKRRRKEFSAVVLSSMEGSRAVVGTVVSMIRVVSL